MLFNVSISFVAINTFFFHRINMVFARIAHSTLLSFFFRAYKGLRDKDFRALSAIFTSGERFSVEFI